MRTAMIAGAALLLSGVALGSTERRVSGVITAVEPGSLTIQPRGKSTVSGRLDSQTTRVTINGHVAKVRDLRVASGVRAELGLDDVWISVRVDAK